LNKLRRNGAQTRKSLRHNGLRPVSRGFHPPRVLSRHILDGDWAFDLVLLGLL
jgi:hypothetical protein